MNHYAIDGLDRICAVKSGANGNNYVNVYDASGHRVEKGTVNVYGVCGSSSGNGFSMTSEAVLGQGGEEFAEYTPSGGWATNVYANGELLATYQGSNLYFALNDWQGTKRVIANVNPATGLGRYVAGFYNLPFGDNFGPYTAEPSSHHFTGQLYDAETYLDYFGARHYAPVWGRFLSPDWSDDPSPVPWADLENPQSLNLYAYVNNNPLSRRDPNGHGCDPDTSSTNANGDTVITAGKCYVDLPLLSMAVGHHFVDQAITKSQGAWNSLAGQFFRPWTTGGPLKSPGVHTGYSKAARLNTQQIQSIVGKYKELSGRDMSQWTKQDIENVVQEVQSAGGDIGKFLADIAEENPTVRTVTADIQDVMGAAQSAYDASKGFVMNAAEDVEAACESEPNCGLPPP